MLVSASTCQAFENLWLLDGRATLLPFRDSERSRFSKRYSSSPLYFELSVAEPQNCFNSCRMPRENRKRGKKHRKSSTSDNVDPTTSAHDIASSQVAGPSWITRVPAKPVEDDGEAPFGYLDSDIKAYFRTVDLQIREWQEDKSLAMAESDTDPNEGTYRLVVNSSRN